MINAVKTQEHIKLVAKLAHKIWNQHYVSIIGQEQVDYMVEKFQSEAAITQQLDNGYQYFFIKHQEKPCGYLAILPNKTKSKLMISKIYVDQNYRGLRLGSKLLAFTFDKAKHKGFKIVWLTVNKYNSRTIKWYKTKGFEVKDKIVMDIGNGFVMDDYLMEKAIS